MSDSHDRNIVRASHSWFGGDLSFWVGCVIAALIFAGALVFFSRDQHSQTTTSDGRNVEAPGTAGSGSAR